MVNILLKLNPVWQALIAGMFTFMVTAIGAAIVFFLKNVNKNFLDASLGFSAGVMIAASFFSLLSPALELANTLHMVAPLVILTGFILGGILLFSGDKLFSKIVSNSLNNKFKRTIMLVLSITLHNIPEGLAVGVAFGSIAFNIEGATFIAAVILTIGIALQNFPEGTAVSLPLRREGLSAKKAFVVGALTAIVEPISAVFGAFLVLKVRYVLPYLLSFAAGAMIYVCCCGRNCS